MLIEKPYEIHTGYMFPNSKGITKCVVLSWRDSNNHDFMPSVFESVLDKTDYECEDLMDFADFVKFIDKHMDEIKADSRALGERFESIVNRYRKIMKLPTEVPKNIIGWTPYDFLESGFDIRFEMKGKTRCWCYVLSDTSEKQHYWNAEGRSGVHVLEFRCEPIEEKPIDQASSETGNDPKDIDYGDLDHAGMYGDDDGQLGWDD